MMWILLISGATCLAFSIILRRRSLALRIFLTVLAIILLISGGVSVWYNHRPQPPETTEILFEGVTYIRDVRQEPRPLIIHVVEIDLTAPGISFLVTPPNRTDGLPLIGRTTSQFLREFDLQIAINGDGYVPWKASGIFDYYPHMGDPVDVFGLASSRGMVYSQARAEVATVYVSRRNQVSFGRPTGTTIYNAISGKTPLLLNGRRNFGAASPELAAPHPRSALAVNAAGDRLLLIVVDGRQPNYSEGVTLHELANIVTEHGGMSAINLDGGGSSALVIEGLDGQPRILNSPIDSHIPGRERVVGNHFGVFARRID